MNTACCNDHFIHKLKNTEALTQRTISCPLAGLVMLSTDLSLGYPLNLDVTNVMHFQGPAIIEALDKCHISLK